MFCTKCGAQLRENALFCSHCGQRVSQSSATDASALAPDKTLAMPCVPSVAQNNARGGSSAAPGDTGELPPNLIDPAYVTPQSLAAKKAKDKKRSALIATVIVLAIVIIAVVLFWFFDYKTPVTFSGSAPGYNSSTDSKIPLQVRGNDALGRSVNQAAYLSSDGTGLKLSRGNYTVTVTVTASPLLANGTFYETPSTSYNIIIGNTGVESGSSNLTIDFTVEPPANITDSQINVSYDAAIASGMDSTQAGKLRDGVKQSKLAAQGTSSSASSTSSSTSTSGSSGSSSSSSSSTALADEIFYHAEYFDFKVPESWAYEYYCDDKTSSQPRWYEYFICRRHKDITGSVAFYVLVSDDAHGKPEDTDFTEDKHYSDGYNGELMGHTSDNKTVYLLWQKDKYRKWISLDELSYIKSTFTLK